MDILVTISLSDEKISAKTERLFLSNISSEIKEIFLTKKFLWIERVSMWVCVHVCVCVCVSRCACVFLCVWKKERENERFIFATTEKSNWTKKAQFFHSFFLQLWSILYFRFPDSDPFWKLNKVERNSVFVLKIILLYFWIFFYFFELELDHFWIINTQFQSKKNISKEPFLFTAKVSNVSWNFYLKALRWPFSDNLLRVKDDWVPASSLSVCYFN